MNAVTCTHWISRGVAKRHPDQVRLDANDLKHLIETVKNTSLTDSDEEESESTVSKGRKRKIQSKNEASNDGNFQTYVFNTHFKVEHFKFGNIRVRGREGVETGKVFPVKVQTCETTHSLMSKSVDT